MSAQMLELLLAEREIARALAPAIVSTRRRSGN